MAAPAMAAPSAWYGGATSTNETHVVIAWKCNFNQ
jgi:hypothetical protein